MEIIKAWALSVCMACIVAGMLHQFTQTKSKYSVIKLVLTLYILITAFTPLQMLRYPDTRFEIPVLLPIQDEIDTQTLLAAQTQKILERTIVKACDAAQCPISSATVSIVQTASDITINQVTVQMPQAGTQAIACKTVQQALGTPVPVIVQKEGFNDG